MVGVCFSEMSSFFQSTGCCNSKHHTLHLHIVHPRFQKGGFADLVIVTTINFTSVMDGILLLFQKYEDMAFGMEEMLQPKFRLRYIGCEILKAVVMKSSIF
jgi:hypothetical protein